MPTDQPEPVRVLLFSVLREKVRTSQLLLQIERAESANAFLNRLVSEIPEVAEFQSTVRLAVNGAYADPDDPVSPGDEVAVITPVSGG